MNTRCRVFAILTVDILVMGFAGTPQNGYAEETITATEYSNIVQDSQTNYNKIRAFVEVNGKKSQR